MDLVSYKLYRNVVLVLDIYYVLSIISCFVFLYFFLRIVYKYVEEKLLKVKE